MVEAILLGTSQDGGVPQAGCGCVTCVRAWQDPTARRYVASLALVDHAAQQSWLIDATPDFREQLHALETMAPEALWTGILLTHAHVGHYAGLIHLGREAMEAHAVPVYATERMGHFLRTNAPWSRLVAGENIDLHPLHRGVPVALTPRLRVTPLLVPHRDEYSDTVAFLVQGPEGRLFYCPDIDSWDAWDLDLRVFLAEVNIALLDATFFSVDELPQRNLQDIPHPLATDTVSRVAGTRCEVHLTHLNHSNPLCLPGPEQEWVAAQGVSVGTFGTRWALGE